MIFEQKNKKYEEFKSTFLKFHDALQAEKYKIIFFKQNDKKMCISSSFKKEKVLSPYTQKLMYDGFTIEEINKNELYEVFKNLENRYAYYIELFPNDKAMYITVDDIQEKDKNTGENTSFKFEIAKNFNFCAKIESSKRNFQGIIKIKPYGGNEEIKGLNIKYLAHNRTVSEINNLCGDREVDKGMQAFRFPLSYNKKYNPIFQVKLRACNNIFCPKAQEIYDKHIEILKEEAKNKSVTLKVEKQEKVKNIAPKVEKKTENFDLFNENEILRHGLTCKQLYEHHALENLKFMKYKNYKDIGQKFDYYVALRLAKCGYEQKEIASIVYCAYYFNDLRQKVSSKNEHEKVQRAKEIADLAYNNEEIRENLAKIEYFMKTKEGGSEALNNYYQTIKKYKKIEKKYAENLKQTFPTQNINICKQLQHSTLNFV